MEIIANGDAVEEVLKALRQQLAAAGESYELVVIGGSGLLVLGTIERATRDVDLVALRSGSSSQDLEALAPTPEELVRAARWTRTHDPSPGFAEVLRRVLAHYGVDDADI